MAKKPFYEEVARACNELVAEDVKPTNKAVHAITQGSMTSVCEHLRRWKEEQGLLAKLSKVLISKVLEDTLCAELTRVQDQGYAVSVEKIRQHEEELDTYAKYVDCLEGQIDDMKEANEVDKIASEVRILELEKKISAQIEINSRVENSKSLVEIKVSDLEKSLEISRKETAKFEYLLESANVYSQETKGHESELKRCVDSLQQKNTLLEKNLAVELKTSDELNKRILLLEKAENEHRRKVTELSESSDLHVGEIESKLSGKDAKIKEISSKHQKLLSSLVLEREKVKDLGTRYEKAQEKISSLERQNVSLESEVAKLSFEGRIVELEHRLGLHGDSKDVDPGRRN